MQTARAEQSTDPEPPRAGLCLVAPSGLTASLEPTQEGQALVVRDARGALLLREGPEGLVLVAEGGLGIEAGGALRLRGERVELEASGARLSLGPEGARLSAPDVAVEAERAHGQIEHATIEGRSVTTRVESLRQFVHTLEIGAERIVERARETYRETAELSQTRAGRLRLIAASTLYAFAESALVKAKDDVKIKGQRIDLG